MDDAQMQDIGRLSGSLRWEVLDYMELPGATHEGARAALALVMGEVQGAIRWKAEVALAAEELEKVNPEPPSDVDIRVDETPQGPL